MKSSKVENVLDYNPPTEDPKTLSPFTYYQPFQSSLDPEFSVSQQKPTLWPSSPRVGNWAQSETERPAGSSQVSSGISSSWDVRGGGVTPQPSTFLKDSFLGASTSTRREPDGRSICNSTWLSPVSPKPSFSGYEESQSSRSFMSNDGGLVMYSYFPPNGDSGFGGLGTSRMEAPSFRTKNAFGPSAPQMSNFDASLNRSSYYPFMVGSSGKGIGQNLFKSGHSRPMMCNFCKNNKEVPDIYLNHYLYDPDTKVLSCPVLRKHVCEVCGGTGDQAHTLQYCPLNRERGLQSKVPVLLKARTITNSTGKIRRN